MNDYIDIVSFITNNLNQAVSDPLRIKLKKTISFNPYQEKWNSTINEIRSYISSLNLQLNLDHSMQSLLPHVVLEIMWANSQDILNLNNLNEIKDYMEYKIQDCK
jgi:adenine-specific DNA methylase